MKALPVRLEYGLGYIPCGAKEATHVTLNIPGPTGLLTLPVIQNGTRAGTGCWTWNGDTEAPTLRPSVLTEGHNFRCHSWINDGCAQFLADCSHELRNTTSPLGDVASQTAQTYSEALRLADEIIGSGQFTPLSTLDAAAAELRRQHARITELESALLSQLRDSRTTITDETCDRLIAALCPDFSDARFPGDRNTLRQMAREALQ